jgi:predicted lactoylglutathione lyase
MTMRTFINLPVRDLAKAVAFFGELGFSFDPRLTNANTTCMIISDDVRVMLHVERAFERFTGKDVADTSTNREVIVSLSTESREQVDELVGKALGAGAQAMDGPQDQGFMYMRGFCDLDGHQWSFLYMDMSVLPEQ